MPRRKFSVTLGDFISSARDNIIETKTSVRSKMIADFNARVVQEGLSLEAQQAFWEDMQQKENVSEFPSAEFNQTVKEQVSTLKKQIRGKKYRDRLQELRNDIAAEKKTNEELASWLEEQAATAVDPDLKEEIQTQIQTTQADVQQDYRDKVNDLLERSKLDHADSITQEALDIVETRLSKALASGNKDAETFWKSQKTVVQQQRNTNKAEDAENDAQLADLQNKPATEVLQIWSNAISKLPDDGIPIFMFVGGAQRRFSSVKDFVTVKRTEYLNDTGPNGFFEKFRDQKSSELDTQITKMGTLNDTVLDNLQRSIDNLARNPDLAGYGPQIENLKYDSNGLLKKAVTNNVNRAVIKFTTDFNFDKAANEIQRLADKYKVDATAQMASLITEFAKQKENIYDKVVSGAAALQADRPGMSWEQAVREASKYLRGGITSPLEFVRTPLMSLIDDAVKTGEQTLMDKGQLKGRATQLPSKATREQMKAQGWSYLGTLSGVNAAKADATKEVVSVAEPSGKINYYWRKKQVAAETTPGEPSQNQQTSGGTSGAGSTATTPPTTGQTKRQKYEAQGWKYIGTIAGKEAAEADQNKIVALLEGDYYWKPKAATSAPPQSPPTPPTTPPVTPPVTGGTTGGTSAPKQQTPRQKWESQGWKYLGNMDTVRAYERDSRKIVRNMDGMYFWRNK